MRPDLAASFQEEFEKIALFVQGKFLTEKAAKLRASLAQSRNAPRSMQQVVSDPAARARPDFSAGRRAVAATAPPQKPSLPTQPAAASAPTKAAKDPTDFGWW